MTKKCLSVVMSVLMVALLAIGAFGLTASAVDYATYDLVLSINYSTNKAVLTATLPEGVASGKLVVQVSDKLSLVADSLAGIDGELNASQETHEEYDRDGVTGIAVAFSRSQEFEAGTQVFYAEFTINGTGITVDDFNAVLWNLSDGLERLATEANGDVNKTVKESFTVSFVAGEGGNFVGEASVEVPAGEEIEYILPDYLLDDGFGFKSYSVTEGTVQSDMTISLEFYRIGDVNFDDYADNLDAAFVLRYDAMMTEFSEEQLLAADVNFDSEINSLDAAQILKYDAAIIGPFIYPDLYE